MVFIPVVARATRVVAVFSPLAWPVVILLISPGHLTAAAKATAASGRHAAPATIKAAARGHAAPATGRHTAAGIAAAHITGGSPPAISPPAFVHR
jgi:hypothetical protein